MQYSRCGSPSSVSYPEVGVFHVQLPFNKRGSGRAKLLRGNQIIFLALYKCLMFKW